MLLYYAFMVWGMFYLCRIIKFVGIKNIIINIFHLERKLSYKHKLRVSTQNYKADLNRKKGEKGQLIKLKYFLAVIS